MKMTICWTTQRNLTVKMRVRPSLRHSWCRASSRIADFQMFGYWMHTAEDGGVEHMQPFFLDREPVWWQRLISTKGTATYAGPATGLYMKKSLSPDGSVNMEGEFSSGQFVASATLNATFDGEDDVARPITTA